MRDYSQWIKEARQTLESLRKQLLKTPRNGQKYIKERIEYETFSIKYAQKEQARQV